MATKIKGSNLTDSTFIIPGDLQASGDIQLGHASDTTIARSSAGVVTIEGNTVITTANSNTPSTTTSSSDADHVLVDDGGVLKKITPSNLGIGGGGGSAADDISAGDAAVNITTTTGNITIDAQETNTDIIFKGTTDRYPGVTSPADYVFLTLDGQEFGSLKLGPSTDIIFPSNNPMGAGRIKFTDGGSQSQIFKSGTTTFITALSGAGDISLNTEFNHTHVKCIAGDRTELYWDNIEKLRTTSTGVYVTGSIDLGHASDTTIARSSAGVATIEGNTIVTADNARVGRNLIINGAMQVAQRATSVASLSSTATYSTCDRFMVQYGSSGTFTESQSTTAPSSSGFSNSLKLDCTTADASPNYLLISQRIEGQNVQHLKKGTSSAISTTLSFYVRSSKTGTYQVNLRDIDNSRIIGATYAISSANTWEFKTVTFAGDTTGAFDNDNAASLDIEWWLAAGSTYNSGAVPTAWEAASNGDRAAGLNVAIGASTSDDFHITGVQLETGSTTTEFEHRGIGDELARCQRYFQSYNEPPARGATSGGSTDRMAFMLPVVMRAAPAVTFSGTLNWYDGAAVGTITSFSATYTEPHSVEFDATFASGSSSAGRAMVKYNAGANGTLKMYAEL